MEMNLILNFVVKISTFFSALDKLVGYSWFTDPRLLRTHNVKFEPSESEKIN